MQTNNLFQGNPNGVPNNQDPYIANSGRLNVGWGNQMNGNMPYTNRYMSNNSALPGRVVFSPDQISPQEIPTNGCPAIFPLSDGKTIIVKALLPNGMFDEQRFVLDEPVMTEEAPKESEFDQMMRRIDALEENFNNALKNLPLQGNQSKKVVAKNEQ